MPPTQSPFFALEYNGASVIVHRPASYDDAVDSARRIFSTLRDPCIQLSFTTQKLRGLEGIQVILSEGVWSDAIKELSVLSIQTELVDTTSGISEDEALSAMDEPEEIDEDRQEGPSSRTRNQATPRSVKNAKVKTSASSASALQATKKAQAARSKLKARKPTGPRLFKPKLPSQAKLPKPQVKSETEPVTVVSLETVKSYTRDNIKNAIANVGSTCGGFEYDYFQEVLDWYLVRSCFTSENTPYFFVAMKKERRTMCIPLIDDFIKIMKEDPRLANGPGVLHHLRVSGEVLDIHAALFILMSRRSLSLSLDNSPARKKALTYQHHSLGA